jgi:hypothetical protein
MKKVFSGLLTFSFLSLGMSQVTSADTKDSYRKVVSIDIGINTKNDLEEKFMYLGSNDVKSYNAADENKLDGKSKDSKDTKYSLLRGLRKAAQVTAFGVATNAFLASGFGDDVMNRIFEKLNELGCSRELSSKVSHFMIMGSMIAGGALAASL